MLSTEMRSSALVSVVRVDPEGHQARRAGHRTAEGRVRVEGRGVAVQGRDVGGHREVGAEDRAVARVPAVAVLAAQKLQRKLDPWVQVARGPVDTDRRRLALEG